MSVYIYWHQISENWEGGGRSFPHSIATQQLLKASDGYRGMYKAREGLSRAAEKFSLWLRMRCLGGLSTPALIWPSLGEHVQTPGRDPR